MLRFTFFRFLISGCILLGVSFVGMAWRELQEGIDYHTAPSSIGASVSLVDMKALPKLPYYRNGAAEPQKPIDLELKRLKLEASIHPVLNPPGSYEDKDAGLTDAPGPSIWTDFRGIDMNQAQGSPPDSHLAVGLDDMVVIVNTSFIVYDKLGGDLLGYDMAGQPLTMNLQTVFSSVIPVSNPFIFDPKVLYDADENRYLMAASACDINCGSAGASQSWWLLAASTTSSATGAWFTWALNARLNGDRLENIWPDYPSLGITNQAVYLTGNMFELGSSSSLRYGKIRLLDKSRVYAGQSSLPWRDFWDIDVAGGRSTLQAAHIYGGTNLEYLVSAWVILASTRIRILRVGCQLCTNPTLDQDFVSVGDFSVAPDAVQPSPTFPLIDTGDYRLLFAVYRNGRLWTGHTIARNFGDGNVAGIGWYEINPSTPSIVQDCSLGRQGFYYYYPALVPDRFGNVAIVFTSSAFTEFASVRVAARKVSDPPCIFPQGSMVLKAGTAYYNQVFGGRNRWGDYSGAAWDPDTFFGDAFWVHGEYAGFRGQNNEWGTWVGALTFAF